MAPYIPPVGRAFALPSAARQEYNHPSKDGETPTISKSGAHKTRPFTAQRAQKRAQFRMPETFDFVGNWEVDEDVERRVVELN